MPLEFTPSDHRRYGTKVNRNAPFGCHLWTASVLGGGYGSFRLRGYQGPAHRLAYCLAYGDIPEGLFVCHDCDRFYPVGDITYRRCVNPTHLFLATNGDNTRDAMRKGRLAYGKRNGHALHPESYAGKMGNYHHEVLYGEQSPNAKLTTDAVRTIRQRYASRTAKGLQLAKEYGISKSLVSAIVNRQIWKHIA